MKKLLSTLFFGLTLASIFFASCNKDNFDYAAWEREQLEKQRIQDSINNKRVEEQFPIIKKYVADNQLQNVQYIDSLGLAYQLLATGDEASYSYSFNSNGAIIAPDATVKYIGKLVPSGTIFQQTEEGKTATLNLSQVITAWQIAFLPKSISYNGKDIPTGGLTSKGLKKGSKIRIITPSPWAYGDTGKQGSSSSDVSIPAKSPLDFTIEVVDIKNK
ncbi:FKBP-type peptidyl-prolyl cis-trans isomerase [Sphingobacterium athyrii]|uniref:Peptidyl-prolyl cis-trans isomerase n=1 Tax=Sphingobacterium athyrii TaxID=2152717 RepID=A0A363NSC5_9SPHI|nr:FKBP-type peptidyl-prolyl cis-trans isomerase [Sphingobacterium athyrii]PUV23620.1 peptidylprolyl isomerase [Sphingobacterium athyrii]